MKIIYAKGKKNLLKEKFIDENLNEHFLEIRQWPKIGLELIYTCIIDGNKTLDIRKDNEQWYDLVRQQDYLANKFGSIIKSQVK